MTAQILLKNDTPAWNPSNKPRWVRSACPKRFTSLAPPKGAEEGNVPPISEDGRAGIARLLAKALNRNQQLILAELSGSDGSSLTSHLVDISERHGIPISTLKLNARILRQLQLIAAADRRSFLTASGDDVLLLLREFEWQAQRLQEVS
ncbi:MAG: hypothetical protein LYZ66_02245 [Nitrososphaerales archaeon]|nr:hypothetical protein [Nitrososphaerales archaeon]